MSWLEAMEAGELAPKTINNTLGTLVVVPQRGGQGKADRGEPGARGSEAAGGAHRARLPAPARDPALPRLLLGGLPAAGRDADRQRPAHLRGDRAADRRPGARRSRRHDRRLPLAQEGETIGSTKSDRFDPVEIGPGLSRTLREQVARRRRDGQRTIESMRRCSSCL